MRCAALVHWSKYTTVLVTEQIKSVPELPPVTIEFGLEKVFAGFW